MAIGLRRGPGLGSYFATAGDMYLASDSDIAEKATLYAPDLASTVAGKTPWLRARFFAQANAVAVAGRMRVELVRVVPIAGAAGSYKLDTPEIAVLASGEFDAPVSGARVLRELPAVARSALVQGLYGCRITLVSGFGTFGWVAGAVLSIQQAWL